ncbi:hypothetical protein C8F01DRAFT_662934 [Mycena amicta]|nr:hypothetical protein C8F01DRAFT_662934 [Mycena amicta]
MIPQTIRYSCVVSPSPSVKEYWAGFGGASGFRILGTRLIRGYIPFSSQRSFLSTSFGFSTRGGASGSMQVAALGARDVHISDLSATPKIPHPSQIINDNLIRMASKASVVITHDDDWADAMHELENSGMFTESTLLGKVLDDFEIETEGGTAFLVRKLVEELPTGHDHGASIVDAGMSNSLRSF